MRRVTLAIVLMCAARPALGQRVAQDSAAAACLARLPMRVDTAFETLFVLLPRRERREPRERFEFRTAQVRAALSAMEALAALEGPDRVPILVETGLVPGISLQELHGLVWFQVRQSGRLAGLSLEQTTGFPSLDTALLRAVTRADSQRTLRPLAGSYAAEPIDLWLAVTAERGSDRVQVARAQRVVERYLGVREEHPRLREDWRRAQWPANWRSAGLGDSIVLDFVVRTDGRVDSASVRVVRGLWRDFAEAARATLLAAHFEPARIGPCVVSARGRMPFVYTIRR